MSDLVFIVPVVILVAFAVEIIVGLYSYQMNQQRHYSFWNELPFELAQGANKSFLPLHYSAVGVFTILWIFYPIFLFYGQMTDYYYVLTFMASWVVTGVAMAAVFILTYVNIKRHLFFLSILFVTTMLNSAMAAILFFRFPYFAYHPIILSTLLALPAIAALLLAINPKMKKWPIMDKITRQDGTIEILRPRHFFLAYTEWSLIALNFILLILISIGLLIVRI
ncbi:MAG: hypothetical protein LKF69_02415 [Bacilli bacterium]|nr:hypothetical protein [Bacilli bacterium]MCH4201624.1 hypothetical protein [Bacilli bacterium]MCH4235638.1 hypothetical protein [Bacilli bacterium]